VGLLPLGWARFVVLPAARMADRVIDGERDPAFAGFASLAESVFHGSRDEDAELARIIGWFAARIGEPLHEEARINAVHAALVDPGIGTVAELAEQAGESMPALSRLCHRAFGFTPKLLLRRQRFMRSLAQFMLDPSLRWIGALDGHYHDQAQFIREFRRFMGMTPSEYAALPHPVLDAFVNERLRVAGSPVQTLDPPRPG
jgi:AraC-like DNA-binding protein